MRIIAGEQRGRRFDAPKGRRHPADVGLRPRGGVQPDRARRRARRDRPVRGLGRRSASRRSRAAPRRAVFVDADRDACRTIERNLERLGLHGAVIRQDVFRALAAERGSYELVLCDPPYGFDAYERLAPPAGTHPGARRRCSSCRPPRSSSQSWPGSRSAPPASTALPALPCSSDDHRDLPRLLRSRHERPRGRDLACGQDLRPDRRRRRRHAAAQDDAVLDRRAPRARP